MGIPTQEVKMDGTPILFGISQKAKCFFGLGIEAPYIKVAKYYTPAFRQVFAHYAKKAPPGMAGGERVKGFYAQRIERG